MRKCRRMSPGLRLVTGALVLFVLTLAAAGCGGSSKHAETPITGRLAFVVQVTDNKFIPANLTVPQGTVVTWRWSGENRHSVVGSFGSGKVESPVHQGDGSFSLTMNAIGTWKYECGIHGAAMTGTIVVK